MTGAPVEVWEGRPAEEWRAAWRVPALHIFRSTTSTNDVARLLAEGGAPSGTCVLADSQTAGRGQRGRRWHDAPGKSVLLSVVLRPPGPGTGEASVAVLPVRVGLAAAHAVREAAGVGLGLKWPNDLVAEGRKVGGILCEGALGEGGGFVVVGIGINVLQEEGDFPPGLEPPATSLRLAAGRPVARPAVAGALARAVAALGAQALLPLSEDERAGYAARDVLFGRMVSVDGDLTGRADGIARDGALRLTGELGVTELRSGTVRPIDHPDAAPVEGGAPGSTLP
jgi:BirA family biotin operon repressor/biotin-[acetyl-CoA-carboxylase] ligase